MTWNLHDPPWLPLFVNSGRNTEALLAGSTTSSLQSFGHRAVNSSSSDFFSNFVNTGPEQASGCHLAVQLLD